MTADVMFLASVDKGNALSRQFEISTVPPIIGKIVMTNLNGNDFEGGWIETTKPAASEITIQKPIGRYYTKEEIKDDLACGEIIEFNIRNSGFFDNIFRKPLSL